MARRAKPKGGFSTTEAPESEADAEDLGPSKTALKAQAHELRKLGLELSKLPPDRLAGTPMPDSLRESLGRYLKTRANGARRRELQYIAKILRTIDPEPLRAAVETFAQGLAGDSVALHRVEKWRDELIDDDQALTRWMDEHPGSDVQRLRSLVRAARRDVDQLEVGQRQPASYRELFRFIRQQMADDPATEPEA